MKKLFSGVLAAAILGLAGCVTVPVQAMSNARQAIQVARLAGAERYAPALYAEARHWLDDASFALKSNNYARARHSANLATRYAREAAAKAKVHRPGGPATASQPATAASGSGGRTG